MKNQRNHSTEGPHVRRISALWIGVLAGLAALVLIPMVGEGLQVRDPGFRYPPAVTRIPDANTQNEINGKDSKNPNFAAANAERKKQIADDSAKLLKLATDLKAEVDKTNKHTLSLNVIRKADAIEKLAHDVKEKMKTSMGTE